MKYFSRDFIDFFKELSENNDRNWFTKEKGRFEASVKKPFESFLKDLIAGTSALDMRITIEPKEAVFRIHKDVRFSKDKSPYKLHMSAIISPYGRKNMVFPGWYIQLGAEETWIGGGAYELSKEQLSDMRYSILHDSSKALSILESKTFVSHYGELQGEQNKVLPEPFKAAVKGLPVLKNKQFYYMASLEPQAMLKDDFLDVCLEYFRAGMEWNVFCEEAMFG
jgi:uncharacterized protein (TIGR02453 family)